MIKKIVRNILVINFFIFSLSFGLKFEDISKEHWAYTSVETLVNKGIIKENRFRFDGNSPLTRYEFASNLARTLDYLDTNKASKKDLDILEALILEFSQELNKIGFDASTFNKKIDGINESIETLNKRITENEKVIEELKKRVETLENKI